MQTLLANMPEDNYLELLKWKLIVDPTSDDELSTLLHHLFDQRLTFNEYIKTQQEVSVLKNRETLTHYQLIPTFYEKQIPIGCLKQLFGLFSRKKTNSALEMIEINDEQTTAPPSLSSIKCSED